VKQLDGDGDLITRFGAVKQNDGFEVVAKGYAAAVEVEDLRHGTVGFRVELEPDARASQVVSAQGLGNRVALPKPDRVVGRFAGRRHGLPSGLVDIDSFAMGKVAGVHLPGAIGQLA
jgi:hypothetical protein